MLLLPNNVKQNIAFLMEQSAVANSAVRFRTLNDEILERIELIRSERIAKLDAGLRQAEQERYTASFAEVMERIAEED